MRSALVLLPLSLAAAAPLLAAETVAVPGFRSVELRGGGDVVVRPGPVQRVTIVSGSSQYTRIYVARDGKLRIDACNGRCPRHYDLRVEIQSPRMPDVAISGGGAITATRGFRAEPDLAAAINGGGRINVRAVAASNVSAAINGGGQILTGASRTLSAAIHGGGEDRYAGNPVTSVAINGGGAVHRD
jgi:hypothetical protein